MMSVSNFTLLELVLARNALRGVKEFLLASVASEPDFGRALESVRAELMEHLKHLDLRGGQRESVRYGICGARSRTEFYDLADQMEQAVQGVLQKTRVPRPESRSPGEPDKEVVAARPPGHADVRPPV